ncbi:hypothetical protein B0H12DRAFT_547583 [Mycena haematopus]|nr:hypothetical protein B0H12DRAFT_547583 [Mycena haematopus]
MFSFMHLSLAVAVLAPASLSTYAAKILVQVGQDNQLTFSPSNITAKVGDVVNFQFLSKNHSVTQSSFASPCTALKGGVDSGFQAVGANATATPEFNLKVGNASKPFFFFSKQDALVDECQKGMVFSINADANSAKSFAAFQVAAEKSASSSSSASTSSKSSKSSTSSSSSSAASKSSGSKILVQVGQNDQLTFSPPNITAKVGDTVTFQFLSKNHSVTQSSFASPCTALKGGVDSGFQPVGANATAIPQFSVKVGNDSKPFFFFSKQDALVNECQKGMVFTINADANSAKSFAAFQAAAEASGSSSSSSSASASSKSSGKNTTSSSSSSTASKSSGSKLTVLVGENNELTFSPPNITAKVGDVVQFQFLSKNHSVTQSSFASPCTALKGGVDSGFQPVAINATAVPEFSFALTNASTPLFFFSGQGVECQKGMVFSINADANSAKSFAAFQAAAEKSGESSSSSSTSSESSGKSASSSSSASTTSKSSGAKLAVLVGENNQLTFSPPNITAKVGDTVEFQFLSKNHSVTQSSFASPCTALKGGVDSGFQAVGANATAIPEFSFTITNASTPLFFFSKQDALVNECQKGMVFTINADANSDKSFAAFQAAAEVSGNTNKKSQRRHPRDFSCTAKVRK